MISFSINQPEAFTKWLHTTVTKAVRAGILATADKMVEVIQTELIPGESPQPVDRGAYRAAWQFAATAEGADVYNTLPYATVIETGARPENIHIGRKMIDALTEWVISKGFVPKVRGTSARARKAKAAQAVDARNIAFAIATSMMKRGIFNRDGKQGLRIGERAAARVPSILAEEIKREIARLG